MVRRLVNGVAALLTREEDTPEFEEHFESLCQSLRPADDDEIALVRTIATARWRLRNAWLTEREAVTSRMEYRSVISDGAEDSLGVDDRIGLAMIDEAQSGLLVRLRRWEQRQREILQSACAELRARHQGRQ